MRAERYTAHQGQPKLPLKSSKFSGTCINLEMKLDEGSGSHIEQDTGRMERSQNPKDCSQEKRYHLRYKNPEEGLGFPQSTAFRDSRQFNSDHKSYRNPK